MNMIPARTFFYGDKYGNTRMGFTVSLEKESEANILLTKETFEKLKRATLDEVDDILGDLNFNKRSSPLLGRKQ